MPPATATDPTDVWKTLLTDSRLTITQPSAQQVPYQLLASGSQALPMFGGMLGGNWVNQQDWYQHLQQNPLAQLLGLVWMMRQSTPQVSFALPIP